MKAKTNVSCAVELGEILILILDRVRSTVDRLGAVYFCRSAPVQQYRGLVSEDLFFAVAHRYQRGWLLFVLNVIST